LSSTTDTYTLSLHDALPISCRRTEIVLGILRIDATLDSVTAHLKFLILKLLARCYLDLLSHEVVIGNFFGYRMLYLDTGIHFNEVEVFFIIHQKFYRSRTFIIDGFRRINSSLAHSFAQSRRHQGRRRFFQDLLVASLQ